MTEFVSRSILGVHETDPRPWKFALPCQFQYRKDDESNTEHENTTSHDIQCDVRTDEFANILMWVGSFQDCIWIPCVMKVEWEVQQLSYDIFLRLILKKWNVQNMTTKSLSFLWSMKFKNVTSTIFIMNRKYKYTLYFSNIFEKVKSFTFNGVQSRQVMYYHDVAVASVINDINWKTDDNFTNTREHVIQQKSDKLHNEFAPVLIYGITFSRDLHFYKSVLLHLRVDLPCLYDCIYHPQSVVMTKWMTISTVTFPSTAS